MDILVHKTTPLSLVDRFLQIFQLVTVLFVQVVAMASQIVSLKARVSKLETVPPTCSDTVELSQRVKDLCDTVASQQEEIRGLKQDLVHQRVEVDASQQKIKTLTTKFSDDGREFNAFVDGLHSTLVDHIKEQQRQASQLAKVSDDITQKIAVLDKGLSSVRLELSVATTAMTSTETQMAGQAAKEARRKHILASVAQRVEEIGLFQEIQALCAPPVKCETAGAKENRPVDSNRVTNRSSTSNSGTAGLVRQASVERKSPQVLCTKITLPNVPQSTDTGTGKAKEVEEGSRVPMMQCVKTAQSGTGPPTAVDITTKVPQVSNLRMTQPGAGSSPKVFGLPKPYQSLLPAPRKSMLPAPRKSMLPAPLKRTILASSNTSKVIQSASCPAKESMMAQMQPKQTASLTATCVPLESIVLSGTENEAPALSASSSLAVLDEAVQESRVDIFALMPTLDSMAFLDASFSVSAVPSVFKCRAPLHKGASLYAPAVRKTVAAKPSRRL